jgi:hypothetical protein
MLRLATTLAVLFYLVPVALTAVARSRRDRPLFAYALDAPLAIGVDLMTVLALTRAMSLESATLVSRAAWILAGALAVRRRRREGALALPSALTPRALAAVSFATAAAVGLSLALSRPYALWDRYWHFPLVSSIGAQRLPFVNVFQPDLVLRYHFSGNVVASQLQTLSLRAMHASFALTVAHDVLFGLTGASLALLFLSFGYRTLTATATGTLAVFLNGPIWFLRGNLGKRYEGYSYLNFFEMSYRPHISLEGLFLVGIAGAVSVRLRDRDAPVRETLPALVVALAALGITDETSTALLGLAVGAAWLVDPNVVHPKRLTGLAALAVALMGLLGANVAFSASLSPGGPAQAFAWVAARAPGFYNEGPRPLTTPEGMRALLFDVAALGAVGAGFVIFFLRRISQRRAALLAFMACLGAAATLGLTHADINETPLECHRFMTATCFVFAHMALLWYRETPSQSIERALFAAAVALPALGTILWAAEWCPGMCPDRMHFGKQDFYATDCRAVTGARLGEAALPTYVSDPILGLYTGCRPLFIPGGEFTHWGPLKTGGPFSGIGTLGEIHDKLLPDGAVLRAACDPRSRDPICADAIKGGRCMPAGSAVLACEIRAEDRRRLLGRAAGK